MRLHNHVRSVNRNNVPGDFVEFGIALGGSAVYLASQAGSRRFQGYDVFAMIPPPGEEDDAHSKARYEVIASGKSAGIGGEAYYGYQDNLFDKVKQTFAEFGVPVDGKKVVLHKGLFEHTVNFGPDDRIALAHVDCDWFDPVKLCLERTSKVLSVGGIIILDDYNAYGGCKKATDQFLRENTNFEFVHTTPNAAIRKTAHH